MNVMRYMRQLESAGFAGETLDRAVALAGASRIIYMALYHAVADQGLSPEAALRTVETTLLQRP